MTRPRLICASFALTIMVGCANPGIVQLSPDTYMLTRTDKGGIFGNPSAMKVHVIQEANEFAASKGKVAIPLSSRETPLVVGRSFASFEYQFRVVDQNDPEARRVNLVPRPDVVIEKTEKTSLDVQTKDESTKPKDTYTELLKLDDLHKRGILTDAEFEAQKKKLLEAQ
jgi:hypothetical protein